MTETRPPSLPSSPPPSPLAVRARQPLPWPPAVFAVPVTIAAMMLVSRYVLMPLHALGDGAWLLAPLLRVAFLVSGPGRMVASRAVPWSVRAEGDEAFAITFAVTVAMAWALTMLFVKRRVRHRMRATAAAAGMETEPPETTSTAAPAVPVMDRRAFLIRSGRGAVAAAGAGTIGYGLFAEPGRLAVTRRAIPIAGLPDSLRGLRIVHLSDIHLGPWTTEASVTRIVEVTNGLAPDLVVMTGDFINAGDRYVKPVFRLLAGLKPKIGTLSVLGNHDWWCGEGPVRDALRANGLPWIDNDRVFLGADRRLTAEPARDGLGLCLAGVGDYWEDIVDLDAALRGCPDDMPRLMLSHNPDVAEHRELLRPAGGGPPPRIDLMLSGHTHGGQIAFPGGYAPIVPSRFGSKYARGLVAGPVCPVLISRGLGMTVVPVRLFSVPEIVVIELVGAKVGHTWMKGMEGMTA